MSATASRIALARIFRASRLVMDRVREYFRFLMSYLSVPNSFQKFKLYQSLIERLAISCLRLVSPILSCGLGELQSIAIIAAHLSALRM